MSSAEVAAYETFVNHFSSPSSSIPIYLAQKLPLLYPDLHPAIILDRCFDPVAYARSPSQVLEGTTIERLGDGLAGISFDEYVPASRRRDGKGKIVGKDAFARWEMSWKKERFLIIVVNWDSYYQGPMRQTFIFSPSYATSSALHLAISAFKSALSHDDMVLVFSDGQFYPDEDLYASVQKASWDDVVLDAGLAARIRAEYGSFLRSEEVYKGLGVPWKRGLMFLGPPGNGKTISIKAIMKEAGVPCLYVKSFNHHEGDEGGIRAVFQKARREAPCLLVLEDLDSLITTKNRSFFLNELDGLEGNDGLFLIGTTNHPERLDGSLSNRPSRFDRKYNFSNPSTPERRSYASFWQKKLASNRSDVSFTENVLDDFANETDGFSFAYLKEAFVSALLFLAGTDEDKEKLRFEVVLLEQVQLLRASLGEKDQPVDVDASRSSSGRRGRGKGRGRGGSCSSSGSC